MARPPTRSLIGALAVLSLSILPLLGEQVVAVQDVELRFYIHGRGAFFDDILLRSEAGKPEPLRLARGRRSPVHRYSGPRELHLWRTEGLDEEGEPQYRSVGKGMLPDATTVLVLLLPSGAFRDETGAAEFELFAMDDGSRAVPVDHVVFFNLTGAALTGVVGENPVAITPGRSAPIDVEPFFKEREVLVQLAVRTREGRRVVLDNRLRFVPDRRTIIVLLPPPRAGSYAIRAFKIQDYVRPDEE